MKKGVLIGLTIVLLVASFGSAGASVEIEGVAFDPSVEVAQTSLNLHGYGLLRYMVFIKAYVGALYLPSGIDHETIFDPVAKRLELEYFHAIKKEDFAKATRSKIEDNIGPEATAALSAEIDRLAELYRDVEPGDRYALTYIPEVGTQLSLNGTLLGTIRGHEFANALFAIWLGESPIDRSFRDRLLGIS